MASHWTKDKRPSRQKYWERHVLEHKKVAHILANKQRQHTKVCVESKKANCTCPVMTEPQALAWWQSKRKGRVVDKYIPLSIQFGNK